MMAAKTTLTPASYRPRIVDAQVERYLRLFGAVEVAGTKWCGKTWTSLAHGASVTYVDRGQNLSIVEADPSYALIGEAPHVIDEWQRVPVIWDYTRHAVDEAGGSKGLWILTGSSTPKKDEVSHSGAGRIGRVRMHPMTLQELGLSTGAVSLSALFDGDFVPSQASCGVVDLAGYACSGGWPEAAGMVAEDAQVLVREYLDAIFEVSIPRLGGDPIVARRLAQSIARNLGQATTLSTLALDVFSDAAAGRTPTDREERLVSSHLDLLSRIFMVDEVPGWVPPSRSPLRMRTKPKRYFADPSLAVALLGMSPQSLLEDWQTFGLVFENLCMRDLDVYARALHAPTSRPVCYYRDDSSLEVDAIVEQADGRWAAFEIKASVAKVDAAAANLLRLRDKLMDDSRARTAPPSFLAVLVGVGEAAYRRPDGVYVIPITALGA